MKHFTSVHDVPDVDALIRAGIDYKSDPFRDKNLGANKRIGCLFFNPSMRTRLSTQIAARQLGMEAIVFNAGQDGWALEFGEDVIMNGTTAEHVKDAAPVLGQYFDILAIRTFPGLKNREEDYNEYALHQFIKYSGIPVISLESATLHPLQSLADLVTVTETFKDKRKPKIVLTWAPHVRALPQCVANSFAQWVNAWGKAEFVITHPAGMDLAKDYTKGATITNNQDEALEGADYVYVKNWSSFENYGHPLEGNAEWMLTPGRLQQTNNAKVMHCLPVRRDVELSSAILDGPNSLVTQQAGNRVCAAQAVLSSILRSNG